MPEGSLADALLAGDRRALARAITLVESTRDDHQEEAAAVLEAVLPATGKAVRLGISGAPGVGKSTFIDAFGTHLTGEGHGVAVLAVDPSSTRSGGSILGDKTRMPVLANDPHAYIRPTPTGGTLGGVARRTREAMLLCEAAGFDVVMVETVGVGQSETAVAGMVDTFALLVGPGAGDDLQGVKRGIVELADLIVVTKADGSLAAAAGAAAADYRSALQLLRPVHEGWRPPVLLVSSREGIGVPDVWQAVMTHRRLILDDGSLARRRAQQAKAWMWAEINEGLVAGLRAKLTAETVTDLERQVAAGILTPAQAARQALDAFASSSRRGPRP